MKKQFLLLLLMTLLPLAGWAIKPIVSGLSGATHLYYDGEAKALITGSIGYPSGYDENTGKIQFVAKTDNAEPTADEIAAATSTFPKQTDANLYYVYYRLTNDGSYYDEDGDWSMVPVRINKATPSYSTDIVGATQLVYNGGEELSLIGTEPVATFGTVKYKLGDGEYSETAPVATNAGTYTVYYKVEAGDNWEAIAEASIEVTVDKATATIVAPTGKENLVYNHAEQQLIEAGSVTTGDGTMQYSLDGETWSDDATSIKKTNANVEGYTVYYKMAEGTNYAATEPATISVVIDQLNINDDVVKVHPSAKADQTFTGSQIKPRSPNSTILYYGTVSSGNNLANSDFSREYGENINAGEGTITLTGKNNLKGERTVTFNITAADIADVEIATIDNQPYTAAEITPELNVTFTSGTNPAYTLKGSDYEVAYTDNKNAGTATVTVTPKADGNFTGDRKTATFTINQATLTITPEAKSKNLGTDDPELTWTANWINGAEELSAQPAVTRTTGESAGNYTISVNVDGITATNYTLVAGENATFTINAAGITITPTTVEKTYGYKLPATFDKDAFEFTAPGLVSGESITALTFTVTDSEGNVKAAEEMLNAGTYTITPSEATATSQSYNFEYATATLTINPLAITISAAPQEVTFGGEPGLARNSDKVNDEWTSWGNTRILMDTEDPNIELYEGHIAKTPFKTKYNVWKEDFVESLTWEEHDGTVANPGIIKVNLKEGYDDKNFDVTTATGAVTYTDVPDAIEIVRLDVNENPTSGTTVADQLKIYNGQTANVVLKANEDAIDAFKTMYKNRWYALVLPFNTSVREVSNAFGYAVVDIFDESSSNTTDVDFKLHIGDLEANKPFILKIDQDRNLNTDPVTFTGVTIAYADEPSASAADGAVKFVGAYDGKKGFEGHQYIFSLGTGNISLTTESSYIPPMSAYIDMSNQMDGMSRAPKFNIEEPDGSTTSISAVELANGKALSGRYTVSALYGGKYVAADLEPRIRMR